jgi:hypothetical protein
MAIGMKVPMSQNLYRLGVICFCFFCIAATCDRDDLKIVVDTASVTDITATTAISGGFVHSDNGEEIIARGVVWDKSAGAKVESNAGITVDGAGLGGYVSYLADLESGTRYYVRAYVTNARTTVYSLQTMVFTTLQPDP